MAPHFCTLAWKIPQTEEPGRLQSMGSLGVSTAERLHFHFSLSFIGEGNGNPLQYSCLENPRDRGAWWAALCGVTRVRHDLAAAAEILSLVAASCLLHFFPGDLLPQDSNKEAKEKILQTQIFSASADDDIVHQLRCFGLAQYVVVTQ